MTIGFDASRAFISNRTGTENYSYQLLKALMLVDKANQYIVYIQPLTFSSTIVQVNVNSARNFKFITIPWPRLWTQGGLALQTFKDKLDVLFVPAHTLPLFRKPGLKTVVTVHDLGSEYLPSMHQVKQRFYLSLMQKYQLKTATKIIAVSKATKNDLIKRLGLSEKKIEVVYEGYDKEKFKVLASSSTSRSGQSSKSKVSDRLISILRQYGLVPGSYFLFVGTIQPRKNLERLIKAFSVVAARRGLASQVFDPEGLRPRRGVPLRVYRLVIVGAKGWMAEEIYKLPKKLGIEDKVKFLGYVPDKELLALYSGALALAFPSLFEGFGLPILEAQACGCPVVTSNVSSMPEVAGKGAILVNPYDIEAIAHAMIRVKGEGERVKLVKAGLENVKRFSWEKCAKETLKVLEKV